MSFLQDSNIIEALKFLETNRGFLGREFLTWLWYHSEVSGHKISVPSMGEFFFYIDDKMVLNSTSGSVHEHILKGGTPAYAREAQSALLTGKLVQEAKFILQRDTEQWLWSMNADDLALRGVRLPAATEPDAQSHMAKRLSYTQLLVDVVEYLFKEYLAIRMTERFETLQQDISLWLTQKFVNTSDLNNN